MGRWVKKKLYSKDFLSSLPLNIILGCFLIHQFVYLVRIYLGEESLLVFTPDGALSFKWLNPSLWLFWFVGLMVIIKTGFFEITGWPSFFAALGALWYIASLIIAFTLGFVNGLLLIAFSMSFTYACIELGKLHKKHPHLPAP